MLIGSGAGNTIGFATGSNTMALGHNANPSSASVSNEITLGDSNISTLRCQVTSITSLSDKRFKKDIKKLNAGLVFINSLRPVTFKWIDPKMDQNVHSGFIAQEVYESIQKHAKDELEKLILTENPDRFEFTQGDILPAAINAIQELSAQVRQLRSELKIVKQEI